MAQAMGLHFSRSRYHCGFGVYCVGLDNLLANRIIDTLFEPCLSGGYGPGRPHALYGLLRKAAHGRWSAPVV